MSGRLAESLLHLAPGEVLRFPLGVWPLAEVLSTAHAGRLTGRLRIGRTEPDLLFAREGAIVGIERPGRAAARGLGSELRSDGHLTAAEAEAFAEGAHGLSDFARRLLSRRLLSAEDLDRAVASHAHRRLFARAAEPDTRVEIEAGLDALAGFHPVHIDVRPVIGFGLILHGSLPAKQAIMRRATGRRARLIAPYDHRRNAHGLPPPLLEVLAPLHFGIELGDPPRLGRFGWTETAGLLLFLDHIGLLELEPLSRSPAGPSASAPPGPAPAAAASEGGHRSPPAAPAGRRRAPGG